MKWSNLKINKCPQCDKDFMLGLTTIPNPDPIKGQLLLHKCGFKISERRYTQIVSSQITAGLEKELEGEYETT